MLEMRYSLEELVSKLQCDNIERDEYNNIIGFKGDKRVLYSNTKDNGGFTIYYQIANGDTIELDSNGYGVYRHDRLRTIIKKYDIDESGSILCDYVDGNKALYNYHETELYDKDGNCYKKYYYDDEYNKQIQYKFGNGNNIDVKNTRINHIEYDEEAYYNLMTNFVSLGNSISSSIASECSNISSICSNISPEAIACDTSGITSAAQSIQDNINNLNETVNYSLLAYDTCDKYLKGRIDKSLIDSLFDEDNFLAKTFKNIIQNNVSDDGNGILEYKETADFDKISRKTNMSIDLENSNLDYNTIGLSKEKIMDELIYIDDNDRDAEVVLYALCNNRPNNYSNFNFNPSSMMHDAAYYNFDTESLKNLRVQSEMINVKGYDVEFAQVLPSDCTKTEELVYNYAKANSINTLNKLPNNFLSCIENDNNVIILTANCDSQLYKGDDWGGYYRHDTNEDSPGVIVIDAHGSLNSKYYTEDTIIHEMAHKFDDSLNKSDVANGLYTSNEAYIRWKSYKEKYSGILPGLVPYGYDYDELAADEKTSEFFAESVVAYFLAPEDLRKACPMVYKELFKFFPRPIPGAAPISVATPRPPSIIGGED